MKSIKKYSVWSKKYKCFVEQHNIKFKYDDNGDLNICFPTDEYILYEVKNRELQK